MSEGSPGSKPRSGVTRDIGCMVELLADDNELANSHPQTARLSASLGVLLVRECRSINISGLREHAKAMIA